MGVDTILLIFGCLLIIGGIIGCILPVIPGPPLSFIGLLLLHLSDYAEISTHTLIVTASLAVIVTILDFIVPVWGTKKFGGSKWGTRGSGIGLIIGLFAGIIGIFIFPFIGAFIGEYMYLSKLKKETNENIDITSRSLKAALGAFIGLLMGTVLKLFISCYILFIFVRELF